MPSTLVIRFGSLGDLCLLGWALAWRRDRLGADRDGRIVLATKPLFADLMAQMRGIDEVVTPVGTDALAAARLGRDLARRGFDSVLDAHNVLRSGLVLAAGRLRCDRRLRKDTFARLALLRGAGPRSALERTMVDRFVELLEPGAAPGDRPSVPPLAHLAAAGNSGGPDGPVLGIAPGAQWDTKRWPQDRFAELVRRHLDAGPGRVRVLLGPRERAWFAGSELDRACRHERVEVCRDLDLPTAARKLAECRTVATNDSGLMHLAEAVGVPVAAMFGPTVEAFGYFPRLPASRVLECDLDCRPCSRNGKRPCHRGDLACLTGIPVDEAWAAVRDLMAPGPNEGSGRHEG